MKQEVIEINCAGYWNWPKELKKLIAQGYIIDAMSYYSNGSGTVVVHKPE